MCAQILVNRGLLFLDTKDYTRALEDIIAAGQVRHDGAGYRYMYVCTYVHTYAHVSLLYVGRYACIQYIRKMHLRTYIMLHVLGVC